MGKRVILLIVCLAALAAAAVAEDFEAIPADLRGAYKFDLSGMFYADDAAFEADLEWLTGKIDELAALKGKLGDSADNLYRAYQVSDEVIPTWWKLWVFSYLTFATNTDKYEYYEKINQASGELDARIQFVMTETQTIDDATLERFYREKPELKDFAFAIEQARRFIPYTLELPREETISELYPYLTGWSERLYQACIDRTDFPDIVVDGDTLNTNINYSALINNKDRSIRRRAWEGYFGSMAEQRDLYALNLIKAIEANDKVATMRGYRNYPDSKFFEDFLTYDGVSAYYDEIAEHAYIREEYDKVKARKIKAATGYDTLYIWDRTAEPEDFVTPHFTITEATGIIKQSLSPLGEEYLLELGKLLEPANHRLDIVGGDKRVTGMFATGWPRGTWLFFSFSYNGYLSDISGLAHESGHAVHHTIQGKTGVLPTYTDGPSYVTEAAAMTNELLLMLYLYENESDLKTKTYYLEQFLENILGLLTNNMFAHLELKIYEGIEDDSIKGPDDLDELAWETVTPYSIYYDLHPEYKNVWSLISHYWESPMYYVHYVFAQALAMVFTEKILTEPGFVDKYIALLESGFDSPAPEIVKETTGVDMFDPDVLSSGFTMLEDKIAELQALYREMGI
ncbi:MAG: M3 family metallopeptidase [bacterium]|jgi:oligoendopeptidase F